MRLFAVVIATISIFHIEAMEWIVNSNNSYADAIRNVAFGDTVTLKDGLYMGCNQVIRVSNITIQALSVLKVVIDCNSSSSHLIIVGENVRVQGIAFVNGFSTDWGGCVGVFGNGVILQDCRFERCRSSYGGGIFLSSAATISTIFNVEITGCNAALGGGLFADQFARLMAYGHIILKENTASELGGGIYLNTSARLEMDVQRSEFLGNRAIRYGGALFAAAGSRIWMSGEHNFVKNSASQSGALHFEMNFATFETGSTINFRENWSGNGAAALLLISGSGVHSRGCVSYIGMIAAFFQI